MQQLPALDYGKALEAKDHSVTLTLGGQRRTVRRARLGLQAKLADLVSSTNDVIDVVLRYVAMASGVDEEDIQLEECADAFNALGELNSPVGVAALARFTGGGRGPPPAFQYNQRGMSAIVHELAYGYGWTADYILELGPEEAWCYLQELHLDRHEQMKFAYTISDVGRDKRGHQKSFKEPVWFRIGYDGVQRPGKPAAPKPAPKPTGTVINLNALAAQRRSDAAARRTR